MAKHPRDPSKWTEEEMRRDTPGYHSAVSNQQADRRRAEAPLSREEGDALAQKVEDLQSRLGALEEIHEAELEALEEQKPAERSTK